LPAWRNGLNRNDYEKNYRLLFNSFLPVELWIGIAPFSAAAMAGIPCIWVQSTAGDGVST
jgi:hypothetical protein